MTSVTPQAARLHPAADARIGLYWLAASGGIHRSMETVPMTFPQARSRDDGRPSREVGKLGDVADIVALGGFANFGLAMSNVNAAGPSSMERASISLEILLNACPLGVA
jgi:hypothetical protein